MPVSPASIELAHRLAEGARAQANRDQQKLEALMELPLHVYHVTDKRNYESVQRKGLSSAKDLCENSGKEDCKAFLRTQRLNCTHLACNVVLRDQKPMPEKALQRCLVGMSPADWYELLNSFVFFWFDRERAEQIKAKYDNSLLLKFSFQPLLRSYEASAYLTPINTGNVSHGGALRCRKTFVPFKKWVEDRWTSEEAGRELPRKRAPKPVELAIAKNIPDIMQFLVSED